MICVNEYYCCLYRNVAITIDATDSVVSSVLN